MTQTHDESPQFDPEAVHAKYAEERAKRMVEGRAEIRDLTRDEAFASYRSDPFTPFIEREPISEDIDVAVIGAGMCGVLAGAELRKVGVEKIRLIDKSGGIGGTWYWNRYPGVMCDVESYIYMPMLEEMNYIPKTRYAFGEEIRLHFDAIAREVRPGRRRALPHRRRGEPMGREQRAMDHPHRPRRRTPARATWSRPWESST